MILPVLKTLRTGAVSVATASLLLISTTAAFAATSSAGPSSQPAGQTGTWYSQAINPANNEVVVVTFNGNQKLEVTVPAGTFSEQVTVFANRIATGGTKATTGLTLASDNWDFRAERPSDNKAFTTFSKKVTINIPFNTSVSGTKAIYYHDGTKWVKLATTINGGTATAESDHFTEFAVLAGTSTATPNVGGFNTNTNWLLITLVSILGIGALSLSLRKN